MATAKGKIDTTSSSGNVFADLNLPNAEELQIKLRLCVAILNIIDARSLTQAQAAKVLGVNQPKVSALIHYKLDGFSVQRLMSFATALGQNVVIEIRPNGKARRQGQITVKAA
jgi:predicted XRE-type DNA-binding protein